MLVITVHSRTFAQCDTEWFRLAATPDGAYGGGYPHRQVRP